MLDIISIIIVIQILINGVLLGAMYGIAAIGLSLIFGTMQIIFLAQGTIIILFAYLCYWLFTLYSIDPYLSILVIVPVSLLFGGGLYHALFRKIAGLEDKKISLLIAVGLMILVESLISIIWTADPRSIRTSYTGYVISVFELVVDITGMIGFLLALLSAICVTIFLKKTLVGKAVRATSQNMDGAVLLGIAPNRVNTVAFAVGIGLAGIAGIATATTWPFDPYYGFIFSLKAMPLG